MSTVWASVALAKPPAKPKPPAVDENGPGAGDCSKVTASARNEGYGFAHVVTLQNNCKRPVICEVWTDVDPDPRHTLRAAAGESQDVITRRGSPASEVNAQFVCRFE